MKTPRDKSYGSSLTAALKDPVEAAAYIEAAMDAEDAAALLLALREVAEAHDIECELESSVLEAVNKVLHAVGLRLSVEPLEAA